MEIVENYLDFDCDILTFDEILDQKSEFNRHTNTPCVEFKDIASFYHREVVLPSKFKYFKVEENKSQRYHWDRRKTAHTEPEKLYNYLARNKTSRKPHNSPITPCFSAGREREKRTGHLGRTENKINRPCTVGYDKGCRKYNSTILSEELSEFSVTRPIQRIYSISQNRENKKIVVENSLYSQIKLSVDTFSNSISFKSDLPSLGRPLKKENGNYRPMSMVKLPLTTKEPVKAKSSKSADAYLRHLKMSTNHGKATFNRPFQEGHFPSLDTRLLEAVSKYNKPLWEDLIGRHET